ncbi:MAG: caspase family protein [Desulfobacterales bacterium]|nr:caspase family protein [Desulfobacterales bacterium]
MKGIFAVILIFALAGSMAGCATPLTNAVSRGDVQQVKTLLDSGAQIDEQGGDPSRTPLAWAITYRHFDIVKLLIERGADLNYRGMGSPLSWAIKVGDINLVNFLIEKGANVNQIQWDLSTPLMEAAQKRNTNIVDLLLERGADLEYAINACAVNKAHWVWGAEPCLATLKPIKAKQDKIAQQKEKEQEIARAKEIEMLKAKEMKDLLKEVVKESSMQKTDSKAVPSIQSDIDKPSFSPSERIMRDNDLAVIIGIEGYQSLPKSDYSYDDAKLVGDYVKALGFKPRNIELLLDERATKSAIEKIIKTWLPNKAKPESRVFVYYSGHGAPEPKTGDAYIVPFDGDPNYLSDTGYPLKSLYDTLAKLQVAEVTVILDSCFSGAGGRSVLAKGARPLVMMTEGFVLPQNIAVLSATLGTQISTSSPEKGHGVFTYYFLKALKDGKKTITEIYEYIKPLVEDEAKAINVQQSPSINPEPEKIKGRFGLRK